MRGTGRPPPDRQSNVIMVPSLKGPIRETFLMAADDLPSSSNISTYSGAANAQIETPVKLVVKTRVIKWYYFQHNSDMENRL